ncbi:MAG: glutamate-1-semialdehyde 2,1-aminomutase [bacterium]|nr:MAG: glutamate-1-semialdehyde 2,1-aminomutase [bacterium]
MTFKTSKQLISQYEKVFHLNDYPDFLTKRVKGAYIYDFDQNKFLDFCLNNGSMILGHAHPRVTRIIKNSISRGYTLTQPNNYPLQLAKLIMSCYPSVESLRFTCSKEQTLQELICILHKKTKRSKILLIGTEYLQFDLKDRIISSHYALKDIETLLSEHHKDLSGICLPALVTHPHLIIHGEEYLKAVQEMAHEHQLTFILDEEHTGFRLALGGGAEYYHIQPDLSLFGRIIGGGFPLYALGGKEEYFPLESTHETVYHPMYYAAGIETIKWLRRENPYSTLSRLVDTLCSQVIHPEIKAHGIESFFSIQLKDCEIPPNSLLDHHLHMPPPFDQCFYVSTAHSENDMLKLSRFLNKITF